MSYANGTTHYNLPQTVGTDKRDWFDTNQAFADIDEALYGAVQQSTSTATAVTALTTRVGEAESDIATIQTSQSTDEANIAALQTLTSQHTTQIADVKADALDMICAVDEGTAQVATVAVSEGEYFRYNDVLYMATAAIAVGDTIVPNTNCRATNVSTELIGKADTSDIPVLSAYTYVVGTSASDSSYLRYRILGKQVFVEANIGPIDIPVTLSQFINDGSLPLPDRNGTFVGLTGVGLVPLLVQINASGGVLIAAQTAQTQNYAVFNVEYFTS